jgi:hypothetical protein
MRRVFVLFGGLRLNAFMTLMWPNDKLTDGGPVTHDNNQKPNPPFGAATC